MLPEKLIVDCTRTASWLKWQYVHTHKLTTLHVLPRATAAGEKKEKEVKPPDVYAARQVKIANLKTTRHNVINATPVAL